MTEANQRPAPFTVPGAAPYMGNSTPHGRSSARVVSLVFVLFGVSVLGAACSRGSASAGVASLGATATTTTQASSGGAGSGANTTANYRAALAYVSCMRLHDVTDMPDPGPNGALDVKFQTGGKGGPPVSRGISRDSSQYISADNSCRHLLPGGVTTPAQSEQALVRDLKLARCMRGHGVPKFPDPNPANPGVVHLVGVDPGSPLYENAQKLCQSLVPGADTK